jgi:amino acid adenylation domain-containing protein
MHYKILLSSIVLDPHETIDKLKMLTPAEEQELLFDFNDTVLDYPKNATIINLFEDQVREHPDRIAVVFDERELTYKELNEKANQLAAYLRERYAIQTEYLVGIKVARSEWMIIAMLGVLKAGSAYVPIDPEYPKERINYIIEDSRCRLVIDDEEIDKFRKEAGNWNKENPLLLSKPGNTAYVIYTSGSTGQPKGVMIEHKNVFAFITWCKLEFQHSDFDVVFGTTSICFDLSVFEIFFTICSGKKLRVLINALFIGNYLHTSGNILLNTVPGVIGALLNEKADLSHVTVLNMAGESIPVKFLNELDGDKIEIRNLYGPSESTTYSTFYRIKKGSQGLIGRPVANTKIYIVNESQNLQPVGVIGEICISGDGLARGYLGKEALTSEKFVLNPFDKGGRLYKTGDLGRWLPGGTIDFIGRKDDQVKIRGYRIEPGEIECRLQSYQGIEQAVVVTKCNEENEKELIAYIVSRQELDLTGIRMHLADALPVYMMPNQFIRMEQLPLTTSGKIDKKKLAGLENGNIESTVAYSAPQDEAEEKLVQIWEEILKKKKIGVNDNFFELGGHSLLAARVMARINKIFFIQLPISVLFKHSTIRLLAERISSNVQKPEESILVPINVNGTKRPVFCAPPAGGNVLVYYELSRSLGEDQPLYAFQAHGVDLVSAPLRSVYEMADAYIREMQKIDTTGPYTLLGYSFGGSVIYEMAIQLLKKGFEVSQLIIFDSLSPDKTLKNYKEMLPENYTNWLLYFTDIYNLSIGNNEQKITLTNDDLLNKVPGEQFQTFYNKISEKEKGITIEQLRAYTDVYIINASISYVPSTNIPINVPVIFFKADQVLTAFSNEQMEKRNEISEGRSRREDLGWRDFISNEVKIYNIPCNHLGMMNKANIDLMVQYLKPHLH